MVLPLLKFKVDAADDSLLGAATPNLKQEFQGKSG
jgi:hypothetical protein